MQNLLEQVAFEARESEFIDDKSGVSARLSISAYENLVSTAERRMLINGEKKTVARLTDFWGVVPAITGKVELVYEGEQEGSYNVAMALIGQAVKKAFLVHFPNPDKLKKGVERDPYGTIRAWFTGGNSINLLLDDSDKTFKKGLESVAGLKKLIERSLPNLKGQELVGYMELALHGLAEFNVINKDFLENTLSFRDMLANMFDDESFGDFN